MTNYIIIIYQHKVITGIIIFSYYIRKVASPNVQIASQSHGHRKLNLVVSEKSNDFSFTIKKGGNFMCKILKKTLAVILIGLGIGILLVLLLPFAGWLFVIGVAIIIVGIIWLSN